jgi:signal transduction histidine kinase
LDNWASNLTEHLATLGELAAGLAHEIRNPLAGIAGVVDVMSKELPADGPSRAIMGDVQKEVLHIQEILNDLLSYARPRPPDFHPSDLNATIEQAVILARQQVLTKPIQIKFNPNPSLPKVDHDPTLIQQVVRNLLINAIQAIAKEGNIDVRLVQEQDCAVIHVDDAGRGIPPEALPKIPLTKTLVTTDFSEVSDRALDYAIALARRYDARIYLAHVITPDPFQFAEPQLPQATYEKVRQAAEEGIYR